LAPEVVDLREALGREGRLAETLTLARGHRTGHGDVRGTGDLVGDRAQRRREATRAQAMFPRASAPHPEELERAAEAAPGFGELADVVTGHPQAALPARAPGGLDPSPQGERLREELARLAPGGARQRLLAGAFEMVERFLAISRKRVV